MPMEMGMVLLLIDIPATDRATLLSFIRLCTHRTGRRGRRRPPSPRLSLPSIPAHSQVVINQLSPPLWVPIDYSMILRC